MRPFAEQRPRPVLGEPFPAPLDPDDAVEDQQDLGARLALAEEDRAGREALDASLATALHELRRQRRLERRLDGGHQRLGVLVTPRAVLAERLAVPVLEVGQPGLVRQRLVGVVDPMPGKRLAPTSACSDRPSAWIVNDKRRPDQRSLPLDERAPAHPPWRRDPGATAAGLDEADPAVAALGRALDVGQLHGLEAMAHGAQIHQGGAHEPAALVAAVDDAARRPP